MTGDDFVQAASQGNWQLVEQYVAAGGDVDYMSSKGWTALNAALQAAVGDHDGDPKRVARYLIEAGADLTIPSPDGWRPLVKTAAWSAYLADILEHLLAHGDGWRGPEDWKGINYAASWRGEAGIRLLCAAGADPDTLDSDGKTPLMRACKKGHAATILALLDAGADPNGRDPDGLTPLMYAAQKPMIDNVLLLLDRGADLALKDKSDRSALDHANAAKREKVAAILKDAEADRRRT